MKFGKKLLLSYLIIGVVPILFLGFYGAYVLKKARLDSMEKFYSAQLYQVNNIINTLIANVEYDIKTLTKHEDVIVRKGTDFTNFLDASEKSFVYDIDKKEKKIVKIFDSYRKSHPHINSVYMGRENGDFVRSHKRPRPTKYDPRERPWYKLAVRYPGRVNRTKPYLSVTSDDVNIGIVKALLDGKGEIYGVVGADITLARLSDFITGVKLLEGSYLMLIDSEGVILTNPDKSKLFKKYSEAGLDYVGEIMRSPSGYISGAGENEKFYMFYYTSPQTGWKICAAVPGEFIWKEAMRLIILSLLVVLIFLALYSSAVYFIAKRVGRPFYKLLNEMRQLAEKIKNREDFDRINFHSRDEFQELAGTFNRMGEELVRVYSELDDNVKRFKQLNKIKSNFISMVSHELRTPLAGIKGAAVLLTGSNVDKKDRKELLEIINTNAGKLQVIIEDLLDISRMESGVFILRKDKIDVTKLMDKAINEMAVIAEGKDIKVKRNYGEGLFIEADYVRIFQAVMNIFGNAIKFSPENSVIKISAERVKGAEVNCPYYVESVIFLEKNYILISISDEGPGIPEKYRKKIFDKFYQVEDILTRKRPGTGIGLSIVKGIVDAHGGTVWAGEGEKGGGAVFYILLPE